MAFKRSPVRSWSAPPAPLLFLFLIAFPFVSAAEAALPPGVGRQDASAGPASWSRLEKEDFLRTAGIVGTVGVLGGVTKSVRITLRNERGTHDAHVQTIDQAAAKFEGRGGQWELNFRDTYKFNVAAYLLDRMLDLNMVPATVERIVDGKPSAVTWWIDDVLMDEKERLAKNVTPPRWARPNWNRQINILLVFDQLIANRDRNLGNIIITKNWTVWLIDHTRAFRMYKELIEPGNLTACDRALLADLRRLDRPSLEENLGGCLNGMEIDGLLARRDRIVEIFDGKIAREGEDAVLFDYLIARRPRR